MFLLVGRKDLRLFTPPARRRRDPPRPDARTARASGRSTTRRRRRARRARPTSSPPTCCPQRAGGPLGAMPSAPWRRRSRPRGRPRRRRSRRASRGRTRRPWPTRRPSRCSRGRDRPRLERKCLRALPQLAQQTSVTLARQGYARTRTTGACCAARAVQVSIHGARRVERNDEVDVRHIQAARRNVSCNENGHVSGTQRLECIQALLLRPSTVKLRDARRRVGECKQLKQDAKPPNERLGRDEHDRRTRDGR